jgi:hypothetical protein
VLVLVLVLVLEREEVVDISFTTPDSIGPAVLDDTTSTVEETMSASEDDRDGRVLLELDVVEVEVMMTSTVEIGAELEALSMMLTTALWLELVEGLALRLDDEVVGSKMTTVEEEMTRDWDGSSSTRTAVDVMTGGDREDVTRPEEDMAVDEDSRMELVDDITSFEVMMGGGEALDDEVDEDTGSSMMVELSDTMIVEDDAVLSVTVTVLVVSEEEVSILTNWVSVTSTVDRVVDVSGSGEGDGEGGGDGEGDGDGEGLGEGDGGGGGAGDGSGDGSGSGKTLLEPATSVIG